MAAMRRAFGIAREEKCLYRAGWLPQALGISALMTRQHVNFAFLNAGHFLDI